MKNGILLAQTLGCNRTALGSDCLNVIEITNNGSCSHGIAAEIFDDWYHLTAEYVKI
jgi:hypothetical protein